MDIQKNNYYDFETDLEEALLGAAHVSELFYVKDLKQRKIFLTEEINQMNVFDSVRHILQFNREDYGIPIEERKPILLYVVSNGGDVDAGFELIDAIMCSKTPVYTINLGYQYSMGFLIGLAGHRRFGTVSATYLLHDGSNFIYNSGAKAQDQMEFNRKVEERIRNYVLARTKITPEEYDSKLRVEWYMFADEAKEKGVVDEIVGIDCDIDQIV